MQTLTTTEATICRTRSSHIVETPGGLFCKRRKNYQYIGVRDGSIITVDSPIELAETLERIGLPQSPSQTKDAIRRGLIFRREEGRTLDSWLALR
jgi:hypothetical protein